jgi:uncharacterized protein
MIAIDTGFFVAASDHTDRFHSSIQAWLPSLREGWVTTWPVITETCHLLRARVSEDAKHDFMQEVTHGAVAIWDIPREDAKRIPKLMEKYAKLPMDLADASLVLLAEHLGHGRILTTDTRDFGAYRWKNTKPFVDLMARSPAP